MIKASRAFADDLEGVLLHYGGLCRVVQLWRQREDNRRAWTYLGRLVPEVCDLEVLKRCFGGGSYRAKLFGGWMRRERHEAYLEQVSFAIGGPPKPYPPRRCVAVSARASRPALLVPLPVAPKGYSYRTP